MPNNPTVPSNAHAVTERAFSILTDNLTRFGSQLSPRHATALRCILARMSRLAGGETSGRWAYGLPCGTGKTQSVVAWCAAAHQLAAPFSVMVAASKVEALCDLKRELIANGVPEESIGLLHSYRYEAAKAQAARAGEAEGFASEPCTVHVADRPILLVTHNRIRCAKGLQQTHYHGGLRSLTVWDESLLVSEHRAIAAVDFRSALGWLEPRILSDANAAAPQRRLVTYLRQLEADFLHELSQQKETGASPQTIRGAPLTEEELTALLACLPNGNPVTNPLRTLLAFSQAPMRAVPCSRGGGIIQYDMAVPKELTNVVVLDASYPIRELERLDQSIQTDSAFHGDVKTYQRVTVHHLRSRAGRSSMEESFRNRREARKVSAEVVDVVRSIPETEGVILFTFKQRGPKGVDYAGILREDLRAAEVDVAAILPNGKPRFVWLTWGQETSLSEFQYCANVILVGVLYRSDVDLAGAIAGQTGDLLTAIDSDTIRRVKLSENVHCTLQALNRGAARRTENGEAHPMRAWLIYPFATIREPLTKAMPGLHWVEWQPRHLTAIGGKSANLEATLADFLRRHQGAGKRISVRALKEAAGAAHIHKNTFRQVLNRVLQQAEGWAMEGRSIAFRAPS